MASISDSSLGSVDSLSLKKTEDDEEKDMQEAQKENVHSSVNASAKKKVVNRSSIYDANPVCDDGPSPVKAARLNREKRIVREVPIAQNDFAQLVATVSRGAVGVLFIVVSMLFLPIHMLTPIMSGMGVLMVVTGSYGVWRVGQGEPRLRSLTRFFVYTLPILGVLGFVVSFILGPGSFAPDFTDLVDTRPKEEPVFIPMPLTNRSR